MTVVAGAAQNRRDVRWGADVGSDGWIRAFESNDLSGREDRHATEANLSGALHGAPTITQVLAEDLDQ